MLRKPWYFFSITLKSCCKLHLLLRLSYKVSNEWVLQTIFVTYIFSVSVRFSVCHITDQWEIFRVKNATLVLHIPFWHLFLFSIKNVCGLIILFFHSVKFLQQTIDQLGTGIRDKKLSVELYEILNKKSCFKKLFWYSCWILKNEMAVEFYQQGQHIYQNFGSTRSLLTTTLKLFHTSCLILSIALGKSESCISNRIQTKQKHHFLAFQH